MRDVKDWSWSKFPEIYRCSPYLNLDPIVSPKAPEETEGATKKADDDTENTAGMGRIMWYCILILSIYEKLCYEISTWNIQFKPRLYCPAFVATHIARSE